MPRSGGAQDRGAYRAQGECGRDDRFILQPHPYRRREAGNVQIVAAGNFVKFQPFIIPGQWHAYPRDQFAWLKIDLLVAQIKIVDVHFTLVNSPLIIGSGQFEHRLGHIQEGQGIGARRRIGNISSDRTDVTDLGRTKHRDHL